jgi:hypothetical protein
MVLLWESHGIIHTLTRKYSCAGFLSKTMFVAGKYASSMVIIDSFFSLGLLSSELGKYPLYASFKDWQCCAVAMSLGCFFGYSRKEEMKPVYIRQTSMLKFQDRLTAEVSR